MTPSKPIASAKGATMSTGVVVAKHEEVTVGPERLEILGGKGGHQLRQVGDRPLARCLHLALAPSFGHPGGRPDEAHGEEVLTETGR